LGGTEDPHPEPEEVESLCRLLNTVGKALDEGKAKTRMNAIYEALEHIRTTSDLDLRIKFKILDVLDMRKNGWVGRTTGQQGPKTIQEIHDDVRSPFYSFLTCRLRNRKRNRNWHDKICLERDKSLVVVMLVMMDGTMLLVQKSIIGLAICQRLG